jgi:hypothetical protein
MGYARHRDAAPALLTFHPRHVKRPELYHSRTGRYIGQAKAAVRGTRRQAIASQGPSKAGSRYFRYFNPYSRSGPAVRSCHTICAGTKMLAASLVKGTATWTQFPAAYSR